MRPVDETLLFAPGPRRRSFARKTARFLHMGLGVILTPLLALALVFYLGGAPRLPARRRWRRALPASPGCTPRWSGDWAISRRLLSSSARWCASPAAKSLQGAGAPNAFAYFVLPIWKMVAPVSICTPSCLSLYIVKWLMYQLFLGGYKERCMPYLNRTYRIADGERLGRAELVERDETAHCLQ
jgi:hypothetical protein